MSARRPQNEVGRLNTVLTILYFGTLWGAIEALLGGLLHRVLPPTVPGRIMLAITLGLLGYAVRRSGWSWLPLGMALVAAPLKLLAAPAYGLPLAAPEVINPALAILAQGASLAVLIPVLGHLGRGDRRLGAATALTGALWAVPYAVLVRWPGLTLYPSREILRSFGAKFPEWALSGQGTVSFLAATVPYGALAGLIAGGIVAASRPSPRQLRPVWLATGTLLWTIVCLASFWLV